MKNYKLKRNRWTMWALPAMTILFFGLIGLGILFSDLLTIPASQQFTP